MAALGRNRGTMTAPRHTKDHKGQVQLDRELDAWLERAMGITRPDPEPVVRDLDP